jgi:hypothetical protein
MRSCRSLCVVLAVLALATTGLANDVLFDFNSGSQGWGSFGPVTTDSGLQATGGVGGTQGRYHVGDFSLAGWGMVDVSPVVNLTAYTGMSVDARLRNVTGYPAFAGIPAMKFLLGIGYAEWSTTVTLNSGYQTFAVNFANLIPDGVYATAPITPAQLANPGLQIKLTMGNVDNTGTAELDYDNIVGIVPEPVSFALFGLGLTLVARRRR